MEQATYEEFIKSMHVHFTRTEVSLGKCAWDTPLYWVHPL